MKPVSVAIVFLSVFGLQAHKAKSHHTHCVKDKQGLEVAGQSDAERKTDCLTRGGTWDEENAVPITVKIDK